MPAKEKNNEYILVSSCLLGNPTRYDGQSKKFSKIELLFSRYNIIPICPEVDGGLSIPRSPCEIKDCKVVSAFGKDCTFEYKKGAQLALDLAKKYNIKYAFLKDRSPSCGSKFIHNGNFDGKVIEGEGITARLLKENGIEVYSEEDIEQFIKEN